jgi:hypothetical protein
VIVADPEAAAVVELLPVPVQQAIWPSLYGVIAKLMS